MVISEGSTRPYRQLGNEPGEQEGHVVLVTTGGERFRFHTKLLSADPLAILVCDDAEKVVASFPWATVARIEDDGDPLAPYRVADPAPTPPAASAPASPGENRWPHLTT